MLHCDLNCDMGEGTGNDGAIMPYITSANIACGYHAGDTNTLKQTILLAKKHGVKIGAHPSFPDRENFGRKEMKLSTGEVYQLVIDQIQILKELALEHGAPLHHVKPHGALYNMAAKDANLAKAIAQAVKDIDANLILYGLSGSCLIREAKAFGLQTKNEVFADRTYNRDGFLTPRSEQNALIEDESAAVQQVLQMVHQQTVTTTAGTKLPMVAETVCLHGDGNNAILLAKAIHHALIMD